MTRPTPMELVFGTEGPARFAELNAAVQRAGLDGADRDAFVLVRETAELLQSLHPEDADAGAIEGFLGFLHAAFLFWVGGERVVELDREALERLLSDAGPPGAVTGEWTYYVQLPPQRVWGHAVASEPPEPLDGWFARLGARGGLDVLAVFGLHPTRPGLTAVEARGSRSPTLDREDGSRAFSPVVEGGERAGLAWVAGVGELLELAYRCHARLPPGGPAQGRQRLPVA